MKPTPFSGIRLVFLTFALGLGTFIQILDTSIANVAISYIAGDLAISPHEGTWVITSFAISNGLVLGITGWLASRFGAVKLFVWSTSLFSIISWLCGLAWNIESLVFFRILQGASAGALIPLSQALLLNHYPQDKQGLALGLWVMIVIVAPILGPIIGGYLTDHYGWRWIFYINIPLGFLSSWFTWILLREEKEEIEKKRLDLVGLLLLVVAISCLQVFFDKGNDMDWLKSPFIRVMITTSVIAFIFFILWNLFSDYPVMNFSYFKYRNFTLGTLLVSIGYLMFFGSLVLLPLWLETQMNYTAFWAGIAVMPIGILPVLLSAFIGRGMKFIDPRYMVTFSYLCFGLSFFWFANLTPDVSLQKLMEMRFAQGIGLAFFFIPLVAIALAPIPPHELAGASGVFNFIRLIVGGGMGTAIYVTVWNRREIFHHSNLAENITLYNPLSIQFYDDLEHALNISTAAAHEQMEKLMTQQAYLMAVNDVFWVTGWVFLLVIPLVWFCYPTTSAQEEAEEHGLA